jgi:glycosyltransferase involved in cell wall biosynthesis
MHQRSTGDESLDLGAVMTLPEADRRPTVSVVICTRNRPDKIGTAVASVLANDHPAFDLTVIDQSTSEATKAVLEPLARDDPRLHYVHVEEAGLSRAYNTGIGRSTGAIIAFTDDDCIVPTDWLTTIAEAFGSDEEGDLLYGQVAALSKADSVAGLTPILEIKQAERLGRHDGFRVIGMGANFAARRRLFDTIGGFDEVLGGGGPLRSSQDFDLAYRTFRAGSVILLRPEVTLRHDGRRDHEDWPALLLNYGIGDGAFYSKHVRCGDMYALRLFVKQIWHHTSRYVLKTAIGRRPDGRFYIRGLFVGINNGRHYKIDRGTKSYVAADTMIPGAS